MGSRTIEILNVILWIGLWCLALGIVVVWSIKKAEDPPRMIFKWVLTLLVFAVMWPVVQASARKEPTTFSDVARMALCGLVLAITWRQSIGALVARPFASLYDGGSEPPVPRPAYSVAQSRQKQGKYLEAVVEIRKQLDRFPTDFEGLLFLAQVQAENLKDLPAAELTIARLCEQPGHAPANIAFAFYSLADWHLKITQDREAARRNLEQIIERFPDSEFALGAAQRIAHLGSPEMLLAPQDRKKFEVAEGPKNLGLLQARAQPQPAEIDLGRQAADYVNHLEQHPLDMEAREKLALLYAGHYGRLDLATDQLEQMIAQPNQPAKLVAHWLNLLADLQIRGGADYETVKPTLERIIEGNPEVAAAQLARNRLSLLKLELKGQGQKETVKMGTYEQNIGLKARGGGRPPQG
jgi:tetratricopeptide (TPR) repeat protein